MIRDFKIAPEQSIGYYVGMITSSFALAQVLTGNIHDISLDLLYVAYRS